MAKKAKKAKKAIAKKARRAVRKTAAAKAVKAGRAPPKKAATSRGAKISVAAHATEQLLRLAATCFGSAPAAASWFAHPKNRLAGRSPKDACKTSGGRAEVRAWLEEIADGAFA